MTKVIQIDEAQFMPNAKQWSEIQVVLLRKINMKCHICGKEPIGHWVGTCDHYYFCDKHKKEVMVLQVSKKQLESELVGGKTQ